MTHARDYSEKLVNYQNKIDRQYKIYAKNDFILKLTYYDSMKSILKERDEFINDLINSGINFWQKVCENCAIFHQLLPDDQENSLIFDSIKCYYQENFICGVEIILRKNPYLHNRKLSKKFNLIENTSDGTELKIKKETQCLLFDFFRDSEQDLEVFDILFETYVNAAQYYFMSE